MSKNYTAEEFAKKLNVSPGTVYDRIRKGEIAKVNNLGRIVRIPSSELNKFKSMRNYFLYNPEKVEAIETTLGKIRKIKGYNSYVLVDVAKAVGFNDTYKLTKAIDKKHTTKLTAEEARDLGLFTSQFGILLINNEGIKQYRSKSRNKLRVDNLMKELNLNFQDSKGLAAPIEAKEKEIETVLPAIQIFEGQQVEIIEVNGEILFELYSTGMALGYLTSNGYAYKTRINKVIENAEISMISHGVKNYLTEPMLYDFMLEAKTEKCKPFRKWVTNDVLPAIRKTGSYSVKKPESKLKYTISDETYSSLSNATIKSMINDLNSSNTNMDERINFNKRTISKLESLLEGRC